MGGGIGGKGKRGGRGAGGPLRDKSLEGHHTKWDCPPDQQRTRHHDMGFAAVIMVLTNA